MGLELVNSFAETEQNAVLFSDVGRYRESDAFKRLGTFSDWYYFPNSDVFAPQKFIHYKRASIEEYDSDGLGDESTNKNMKNWFDKLARDSRQYEYLLRKLEAFLQGCGKDLCKKTREGSGGIYVPAEHLAAVDYPDQVTDRHYIEGAAKTVVVNAYERNPRARDACIKRWGSTCYVCGFDFGKVYGELGAGLIHVHHLKELSGIGVEYEVDPVVDLRPLCPNCHAMVHRENPALGLQNLKARMGKTRIGAELCRLFEK